MADTPIKELYEFLNNYNLIQSDLTDEEAQDLINSIYSSMEPDENLLTGFIADFSVNDETIPRTFFVSNKGRILHFPGIESLNNDLTIDDVEYITENEDSTLTLKFKDNDEIIIRGSSNEGIETISDALYSAFSESLDAEKLADIFGEEAEEDEENDEPQEIEVVEEKQEPATTETDLVQSAPKDITFTTQTQNALDNAKDISQGSSVSESSTAQAEKKPFQLTRPMIYTLAGIGILALLLIGFFVYRNISTNNANQEIVNSVLDLFNEADEIYFKLSDYRTNQYANLNVDELIQLDQQAEDIRTRLLEIEPNEATQPLYDEVYFFVDALQSSIYNLRTFATTQSQLNRMSFETMLDQAHSYRLNILKTLRSDFPDAHERVARERDMDLDEEFAESVENSTPSQGALNRENSTSSNENVENSTSSREAYLNSKSSQQ